MNSDILNNILATVAYYDCLNYPLTAFEIWKYSTNYESDTNIRITNESCNRKYSLCNIVFELENNSGLKKYIEEYRGFYFLKGRKNLVEERIKRNKIAIGKMKQLRRVACLLRFVPFVRAILVTGRLAMKNTENESDWDILMVIKNGKIWTGRTLVTLLIHLIIKRRHKNKIKDRVCLNYFITGDSLEISNKDLYSANEYHFTFPLFSVGGVFRKFQLQNRWIKNFRPNYQPEEISNLKIIKDSWLSRISRTLGEALLGFDFLENRLRKWEKEKIMKNPKTQKKGGLIIASDEKLIFLPEPQGPEIFERFKEKMRFLISN